MEKLACWWQFNPMHDIGFSRCEVNALQMKLLHYFLKAHMLKPGFLIIYLFRL